MTRILLPLLLALSFIAPSSLRAQALPTNQLEAIVAVVEEDVILRSELDRAVANVTRQYADNPQQLPPLSSLEKQVLERLVQMRLQVQRAESVGIRVSDVEIEGAVRAIAQQNGVDAEQMRRQIEADGFSFQAFRETLREEMLVQRLRSRVMQSRVSVSDTEIDILLARGSLSGKQYHIANLLVGLPDGATPEQMTTGREKVDGIRKLIVEGMDFGAAAIRYSDAPNALEGGELGWRSLEEIPASFVTLIGEMKAGDVSEPLRGPSGFQLIYVREIRDGSQPRMVQELQLRDILIRTTELVDEARARAKIDELRARSLQGEDFGALAKEFSQNSASASLNGDMGWMAAGSFPPDFEQAISSLKDGEISAPIRSAQGWHLIQRVATREQDRTTDLLREEARQIISRRKADEEFERFIRQMRDEAYVDTRLASS
jgi:peptidyl-prolyl cis-trans isomerase SurA